MRRVRALVALTVLSTVTAGFAAPPVLGSTSPPESAVVLPQGRITHAGRWMTDERGRVVIVHGVNVPTKTLPADPVSLAFADDDATLLAASGFNAVRLTVERYAVEPTPGHFDDNYIARFLETVAMLERHGILSLIDFHQDEYGPVFFDNGFPNWMTMTDGAPNNYYVGFPLQYFANPALNRAYDHLWANDVGPSGRRLWDDDAGILARVAGKLAGARGLLGYEIMNEPWPGTIYPTCIQPAGCPLFDEGAYSAYHARIIKALRATDTKNLVWYEPLTTFNQGVPTYMVPPKDPQLGFAFHDYPLCGIVGDVGDSIGAPTPPDVGCTHDMVMANAQAHSNATGSALLETEFGATMETRRLLPALAQYDQSMMPWMFWSYTRYITAYTADGKALKPATGANVNQAMLATLARPYPQLVAGTPVGWRFDPTSKAFTFRYSPARADGHGAFAAGAETDVAVPMTQYPKGYTVAVYGGTIASSPNASVLRVRAAKGPGPVIVNIAPAGSALNVNSACPAGASRAGPLALQATGTSSPPGDLVVCTSATGTADGTLTFGTDSVMFDGRPSNPNLLAGYLGVDRKDTLTIVGCNHGDYDPNAPDDYSPTPDPYANNAMASLGKDTYTAPAGPVGPTSSCSPKPYDTGSSGPCGGAQDPERPPSASTAPTGSPLSVYQSGSGPPDPTRYGYAGVAGEFGGNNGASGYLQLTYGSGPAGDIATGGTSKGGGGTVAVGNDGRESGDRITPTGLPVTACQN